MPTPLPDDLPDDEELTYPPCLERGYYDETDPECYQCEYADECKSGVDSRDDVGDEPF